MEEENGGDEVQTTPGKKMRRDEWSETGMASLLGAYQSIWSFRNRTKLKGSDWDEIAQQVSVRSPGAKRASQCKNKIESMKKRFRSESANGGSSWQFYGLMNSLLNGNPTATTNNNIDNDNNNGSLYLQPKSVVPNMEVEMEINRGGGCGDDGSKTLPENNSDGSCGGRRKRRRRINDEVAESIVLVSQSMLRIEEMRMEVWKEMEKLRTEAEIKREEMELKRTEIIANTQLQIARLFSGMGSCGCAQ